MEGQESYTTESELLLGSSQRLFRRSEQVDSPALDLSIVIPIHNEEESLPVLHQEISSVLKTRDLSYEIVFVDDGSTDRSALVLEQLAARDPRVCVVNFRRNFGQTAAMDAGFKQAQGEVVVALDGDLQNDPRDIFVLYDRLLEGYDLVSGWRKNRQDKAFSRKVPSFFANRLIRYLTGVHLNDYGCSLKAYRKDLLANMNLYGEMHRFIPALASAVGARIGEIPVNHRARSFGKTKYGISRTFRVLMDLMTVQFQMKFLARPMHVIGIPGAVSVILGSLIGVYLTYQKFILGMPIGGRPLLLLAALLVVIGVQFFGMGIIAELLGRIYFESSSKRPYFIRSIIREGKRVPHAN